MRGLAGPDGRLISILWETWCQACVSLIQITKRRHLMKCYNHDDEHAVGICKNCFKALCKQCIVPNEENVIVCSAKCLEEMIVYNLMMEKSKMAYGLKPGRIPATIIFLFLAGLFFAVFGFLMIIGGSNGGFFLLGIGLLFTVAGGLYYYNQKKSGIKV
jgi:hypothetical protein